MSKLGELDRTEQARRERATAAPVRHRLHVIRGADAGLTLEIDAAAPHRQYVGTSKASSLVLSDRQVSRRHLGLEPTDDGRVRLVDVGSTNGTTVNGVAVVEALLTGGEAIRIGATELRVEACALGESAALWPADRFGRVLGASPAMLRLYPLCQKLAAADLPLLVEGETGTGKELLAESIHEMSARAEAPFVVFDAAAVRGAEAAAALFGLEDLRARKGERVVRRGAFDEAHGGTLLIDEIGELDLVAQSRLVRALERGEFSRVNGDEWHAADVRVVATSRIDLEREVERERFREDLFYRLAVGRIELPPLRERAGDVAVLARHFWAQIARPGVAMPPELLASHEGYAWPGNVRELANVVARVVALGDDWIVTEARSPDGAGGPVGGGDGGARLFERIAAMELSLPEARALVVEEFERFYVARMLAKFGGNVTRAAAASGIARRYFRLLKSRQR
jgi:DNA-binding NtrC family response regulator